MRCQTFPHIDIIALISFICASVTTAIHGAVDIGDSCFSMSSMSSVLWVRLDTGDLDDGNATVVTANGDECLLPNRKIIKGSWGAELVFEVSPSWQCRLPGDDIELKAKKGGGFISCHEEMQKAEKEVEAMVSYYNHVVATHAALFTTTMSVSMTPSTTILPIISSTISPYNSSVNNSKSDNSKEKKNISGKGKHIRHDQVIVENKKNKTNKHIKQKVKSNKRNGGVHKDIGKEKDETAINKPQQDKTSHFLPDYAQVTPDASWFTSIKRKKVHTHTTEKTNDWQFDSSNPYQDDHSYSDSGSNDDWNRKPQENINKYDDDIGNMLNTNKEAPQDLYLFQFNNGVSLSMEEYIIIGTGSIIGIALLISATVLIIVLRRRKRDEPVDYWV
ncbi:unnamed protein product [Meganyctiphanes norvegica]|uniref:Uncharacterized protein n=1 Tax=Meganyctiphanes norvegica TaxID=48144 RepID=A0AAV2RQF4_MEGNR